ncbi:MAG TPA: S41 family peptidase, partial [Blastocatellia bacterium]|nr:S41 family peptidase [Blastocatellia bacterium]
MKRLILIVIILALGLQAQAIDLRAESPPPQDVSEQAKRLKAFDIVWRTVNDRHFDSTFGGLDWARVKERYEPLASAAKTDDELYEVLRKMLAELRQSHFQIIPPEALAKAERTASGKEPPAGYTGIDLRVIEGQAVITRVDAGSPADRAGLRPGFVIEKIGDVTVEQVRARHAKKNGPGSDRAIFLYGELTGRLNGNPETAVTVSYLDHADRLHQATIAREKSKGQVTKPYGNFPPVYAEMESKRLDGNIGYIRFNFFVPPLMAHIRAAILRMADARGLIIDLRGNQGGFAGMVNGIAGLLSSNEVVLGKFKMRSGEQKVLGFPQEGAYTGPLVVLTDGLSASASEVFAAGMQEINRAVVIGERTAGAVL